MRGIERDPIVIVSLGHSWNTSGVDLTSQAFTKITGIPHEPVVGCFDGEKEVSVILTASRWRQHEDELRELLNKHEQKCILFCDGQRNAYLCNAPAFDIDREAVKHHLGELVSRPRRQMTSLPLSYTQVGENIHYVR